MAAWRYRWYDEANPRGWADWFGQQSTRVKAKHDAVFDILEQRPHTEWRRPQAAKLTDVTPAIHEVRISTDVEHRILGYFSDDFEFTVTGIGYHKGKKWTPRNIISNSAEKRQEIESNRRKAVDCVRPQTP